MSLKKVLCILILGTMVLASSTAYAGYNYYEEAKRGKDYNREYENTVARFVAYGDEEDVFTSMYNKTTSSYYMSATTKTYHEERGWISTQDEEGMVKPATMLVTDIIPREYYNNRYKYYHIGAVYTAPSINSTVMDYYRYINDQTVSPQ